MSTAQYPCHFNPVFATPMKTRGLAEICGSQWISSVFLEQSAIVGDKACESPMLDCDCLAQVNTTSKTHRAKSAPQANMGQKLILCCVEIYNIIVKNIYKKH